MDARTELRQIAKRVNQRLVRIERSGETWVTEYQRAMERITMLRPVGKSGKVRLPETNKSLSDIEVEKLLVTARKLDTYKQLTATGRKEMKKEVRENFKKKYSDVTDANMNDYLNFVKSATYKDIDRYVNSAEIIDMIIEHGADSEDVIGNAWKEFTESGEQSLEKFLSLVMTGHM